MSKTLAWIITHQDGRVIHFSVKDGWTLDIVSEKESSVEPAPPREPTQAQRTIAFNYAEGFAGKATVTTLDVLDAYYAIRDAASREREPVAHIAITDEALRTNPSATLTTTTAEPVAQPERIACAAVQSRGMTLAMPAPFRHHDILHRMSAMGLPNTRDVAEQGFLTSAGRFVDRETARAIATAASQLLSRAGNTRELFSEDVW